MSSLFESRLKLVESSSAMDVFLFLLLKLSLITRTESIHCVEVLAPYANIELLESW